MAVLVDFPIQVVWVYIAAGRVRSPAAPRDRGFLAASWLAFLTAVIYEGPFTHETAGLLRIPSYVPKPWRESEVSSLGVTRVIISDSTGSTTNSFVSVHSCQGIQTLGSVGYITVCAFLCVGPGSR